MKIICAIALFCCGFALHAQIAGDMDSALDARQLCWAQAARFVLPAASLAEPEITPAQAFSQARDAGLVLGKARAETPITLAGLSFLLMQSFKTPGGLMYQLFPGPRYAYRELLYRRWFPEQSDPGQRVSGDLFFFLLNVFQREYGVDAVQAAEDNVLFKMSR